MSVSIAIAQINPVVGDIDGNAEKILSFYKKAKGADLVVFPELCLIGYPPEDLVLMPAFRKRAMAAVKSLAKETRGGAAMLVGSVWQEKVRIYNAALLLSDGKIAHVQAKRKLPNEGIFDEKRIFTAGEKSRAVTFRGIKLGLLICEDMWTKEAAIDLKKQGAKLLIVINASPFEAGKLAHRKKIAAKTARAVKLPLAYVNLVGGQDDIVFDGGSFMMSAAGKVTAQAEEFEESIIPAKAGISGNTTSGSRSPLKAGMEMEETIWQAMMLGLGDYVRKNNFPGVLIGLSGGIDSALTACVAVDALGKDRVKGVLLPSPHTSKESVHDAQALAKTLGIVTDMIPITPAMQIFDEVLSPIFRDSAWAEDLAVGGNVQARLRGLTLMALSNQSGRMLMSTGNKSEIAVGYTTLYGDSAGGYNVIKDLYKTQVYALAKWRNARRAGGDVIPANSISRAPSAELAPNQKDQDQLPPYDILDRILYHHIEERRGEEEIIALGFDAATVKKVVKMVRNSEFKRRQSCPGVKLSPMLFGRDRRFPITNKF